MNRFSPKSLRQRIMLFVLLPTAFLLLAFGIVGFLYARGKLLTQWGEAAILKLERAAHHVDMRLAASRMWFSLFQASFVQPFSRPVQELILKQMRQAEGVVDVAVILAEPRKPSVFPRMLPNVLGRGMYGMGLGQGRFASKTAVRMSKPKLDPKRGSKTVVISADLFDIADEPVGRIEITLAFEYLIEDIQSSGWWQSNRAFLVDQDGQVLAATTSDAALFLAANGSEIESRILDRLQRQPFGIEMGKGYPSAEIGGFYRLHEADWYLVMIAPGSDILAPMVRFRLVYIVSLISVVFLTMLLIRRTMRHTVDAIRDVSRAARSLAGGKFTKLAVSSRDEVGELAQSFNEMAIQLQERLRMKQSLSLAMEIQQTLLPDRTVRFQQLDIVGKTLYSDETGGDYYDVIPIPGMDGRRIAVAVGDGAEHGVAAALLMTTVRALLRSRILIGGGMAQVVTDVNRWLCIDTASTGTFMTLFVMTLDVDRKSICWVRAGHEPAMYYDASAERFEDFGGAGIALGVDDTWEYAEYCFKGWKPGDILLVGTDGIWETENPAGLRYGKHRLQAVIRKNRKAPASQMLDAIIADVTAFREELPVDDDITLVILKF
ncbi:SpoIIE family protein phosphatase [Desulfatirhabdium butyrativorans]|uniref:SpoIIE family protein phosphatase n=1 Tax=Desulfatirhabdium butyrativorans TaxID=340467 RepID=UPI00041BCCED|nr:SpoIIE family protein phosphatase [Desulfatirhabdium butyrativorans]